LLARACKGAVASLAHDGSGILKAQASTPATMRGTVPPSPGFQWERLRLDRHQEHAAGEGPAPLLLFLLHRSAYLWGDIPREEDPMEVSELLDKTRGDISAKRVFGEPVQQGDAIIIPAARVSGGAGGGEGTGPAEQGSGTGSGFGLSARPAGAFIVQNGQVRWQPAIDVNRIILGGQIVAMVGLWVLGMVIRARSRPSFIPISKRGLRLLSFLRHA
jgi:uncharacterized spore protein YtfJ